MDDKHRKFAGYVFLAGVCVALLLPAGLAAAQIPGLRPASGMFLVAEPQMRDPRFKRTVILLVEHSAEGSLGFIINRKTHLTVADAFPELEEHITAGHALFFGGPVQPDRAAYVYRTPQPADGQKVLDDVYWGSSAKEMKQLLHDKREDALRIFIGYAGWGSGQLEFELSLGDWQLIPASVDYIFRQDAEHLWRLLNREESGVVARLPAGLTP